MKPLLVGEVNPYGGDPHFALYPAPDGCSGHRLCCVILGMRRAAYLDLFDRCNLCVGRWSLREARKEAAIIQARRPAPRVILCGAKVAKAWDVPFAPFELMEGGTILVLPHPSGLCRLWNGPGAIQRARVAVAEFAPDAASDIGVVRLLESNR